MTDSDNKRLPSEEEPQEEFVDDSISQETDESKYETWSLGKLREEAKKVDMPNYDKLSKKMLIERLKKY